MSHDAIRPPGQSRFSSCGYPWLCPASCTISVPKTIKVKIKRKTFTVKVAAARTLAGGKKLNVGLTLPKAAYKRLKGRTASVSIAVSATATGAKTTTLTVKATIRR